MNNKFANARDPNKNSDCPGFREAFRFCSQWIANAVGSFRALAIAFLSVLVWLVTGPIFHYSDTWQLVINTATTIVTFLMVFLIQNTQNRDSKAVHLKLDELIRAIEGARNHLVDIERLSDTELQRLQKQFEHIGKKADATREHVEEIKEEIESR